jgi:protein-L-isoaspartate(D-aspartate) O-methyltransferase
MIMIDTPKHQGMRKMLVKLIEEKGITDKKVLEAIMKVPRHLFMDSGFIEFAYQDKPFPIAAEQTISQPFTVAFQTELLQLKEGEKVLEVGTGSGYQTAVLIELKAKVYSIERQQELFRKTKLFLPKIGYYAKSLVFGDGYKGIPEHAPFDKIIVTAGAPTIPKTLLSQLKIGGRMVIPVGEEIQTMMVIIRKSETEFEKEEHGSFRFVPLLRDRN